MKRTIAFALCAALLLCLTGCRFQITVPEPETTTASPAYVTDINGKDVPVFDNVERTSLDPAKFRKNENGRMTYNGDGFNVYAGVDVSRFQGDVDWNAVAADGIDFVMLRIGGRGYGPDAELYEDAKFPENYAGAKAAGLRVGVYFFSQAVTIEEAAQEAAYTLQLLDGAALDLPVAFDWEHVEDATARTAAMEGAQITSFAKAYCDAVTAAGYQAVIYFNREHGYFNYELSQIADYHFWYAEYADVPSFIYDYKMWQYTEEGTVNGIEGHVDLNIALEPAVG